MRAVARISVSGTAVELVDQIVDVVVGQRGDVRVCLLRRGQSAEGRHDVQRCVHQVCVNLLTYTLETFIRAYPLVWRCFAFTLSAVCMRLAQCLGAWARPPPVRPPSFSIPLQV